MKPAPRSLLERDWPYAADVDTVIMPLSEYNALMAAAKALKRYHHPPSGIDAPDCPCCNCEGERAIAALRAAGIQIEGEYDEALLAAAKALQLVYKLIDFPGWESEECQPALKATNEAIAALRAAGIAEDKI